MKTFLIFAAVFYATLPARADEVQPYHPKSVSQFASDAGARDPFWPIGHVHAQRDVIVEAPKLDLKSAQFEVSSISMSGNVRLAVINQKVRGVGEVVVLTVGSQRLPVQILAIDDGAVVLQYQGQRATVPLRQTQAKLTAPATAGETVPDAVTPLPALK